MPFDRNFRRICFVGALAAASAAQAAPCDLSPILLSRSYQGAFSLGTQVVQTDTVISVQFIQSGPGVVTIIRTEDTFLPRFAEAIAGQIAAADKTLPKNDCNKYAFVNGQNVRVTPPMFTVNAEIQATLWFCSPNNIKVLEIESPNLFALAEADSSGPYSTMFIDQDEPAVFIPAQFGGWNPIFPTILPSPIPLPIPLPLPPVIRPPNVTIPVPRVKSKVAEGHVYVQIVLTGVIERGSPSVLVSRSVDARLDAKTQFVLAALGGPSLGLFLKPLVEGGLKQIGAKNLAFIPNSIKLPKGPREQIEWQAKTAAFASKQYKGAFVPTFVVTREFTTREGTACYLREVLSDLR